MLGKVCDIQLLHSAHDRAEVRGKKSFSRRDGGAAEKGRTENITSPEEKVRGTHGSYVHHNLRSSGQEELHNLGSSGQEDHHPDHGAAAEGQGCSCHHDQEREGALRVLHEDDKTPRHDPAPERGAQVPLLLGLRREHGVTHQQLARERAVRPLQQALPQQGQGGGAHEGEPRVAVRGVRGQVLLPVRLGRARGRGAHLRSLRHLRREAQEGRRLDGRAQGQSPRHQEEGDEGVRGRDDVHDDGGRIETEISDVSIVLIMIINIIEAMRRRREALVIL